MKCFNSILNWSLSLGLWVAVFPLYGQKPPDTRKTENMLLQEKLFIDAMREKIIGDETEAISLFNEVIKKDTERKNAAAHYQLAKIYEKQKNGLENALREAEIAANIEKNSLEYSLLYATLLEKKADYKLAVEIYEYLTKIYPDNADLYFQWAFLLTKMDKNEAAIKVYNRLEAQIGLPVDLALRRYQLHLAMNKPKAAENELLQLCQIFPNDIFLLLKLADFYQNGRQTDKAEPIYTQILKLDPNENDANLEMAKICLTKKDEKGYFASLARIFENPQQAVENKLLTLAPLLDKAFKSTDPNYQNAVFDLAQKLHQTQPDNAQARLFYAQTLQFAKKYELAFAEYTAAARTLKNSLELWRGLLQTALILQKISELSQFAAETANLFPNHALGYYYLAVAQNLQSQPQKALDNATEALLWATDDLLMQKLIYQELANAYTLLNLPDKAAQARQKAEK